SRGLGLQPKTRAARLVSGSLKSAAAAPSTDFRNRASRDNGFQLRCAAVIGISQWSLARSTATRADERAETGDSCCHPVDPKSLGERLVLFKFLEWRHYPVSVRTRSNLPVHTDPS